MKKFIPYLFLSATTIHSFIGASPIMAMGCSSHSDKAEIICEDNKNKCQEKNSKSRIN